MFTVCEWEINEGSSCLNTLYVNVQLFQNQMAQAQLMCLNTLYVNVQHTKIDIIVYGGASLNTLYVNVQHFICFFFNFDISV